MKVATLKVVQSVESKENESTTMTAISTDIVIYIMQLLGNKDDKYKDAKKSINKILQHASEADPHPIFSLVEFKKLAEQHMTSQSVTQQISLGVGLNLLVERDLKTEHLEVADATIQSDGIGGYTCLVREGLERKFIKKNKLHFIDDSAIRAATETLPTEKPTYNFPYTNNYPFMYSGNIYMVEHASQRLLQLDGIASEDYERVEVEVPKGMK